MLLFLKTRDVAKQLGSSHHQLRYLIDTNRLKAPNKDSAGEYVWLAEDIERARAALTEWRAVRSVKRWPVCNMVDVAELNSAASAEGVRVLTSRTP